MKILLLSLFLFVSLIARDNPFIALFDNPSQAQNDISILNITTNPTFTNTQKIKLVKKTTLPTIKIIEKVPTPHAPTIKPIQTLPPTTIATPIMIPVQKVLPPKQKKYKKKRKKGKLSYTTIYQNYFLKIMTNGKNIKIFTKDNLTEKRVYTSPSRVSLDFDKLQYFHTKSIPLYNAFARKLKVGSHHNFYRITLLLKKKKSLKVHKKSYGYLLVFN